MSEENGLEAFRSLGLSGATLAALEKKGFSEPTEIQKACIPLLLDGQKDVIGQAQTGTGKTAAFGLPIIELLDTEDSSTQGAARRAGDLDGDGLLTTQDLVLLSQRLEP